MKENWEMWGSWDVLGVNEQLGDNEKRIEDYQKTSNRNCELHCKGEL